MSLAVCFTSRKWRLQPSPQSNHFLYGEPGGRGRREQLQSCVLLQLTAREKLRCFWYARNIIGNTFFFQSFKSFKSLLMLSNFFLPFLVALLHQENEACMHNCWSLKLLSSIGFKFESRFMYTYFVSCSRGLFVALFLISVLC